MPDLLISPCQTAFVQGRKTGDNALLAQSLCRDYHLSTGAPRIALKLDIIRKAFDTLNWVFIFKVMELMGFPQKYINWVRACITTDMISVKINGALEGYFKGNSGLKQGDPLSPYLFVLAMEVFTACMIAAVKSKDFSFHWHTKDSSISHLIFADDVLLFCKGNIKSVHVILDAVNKFANMSGLQPNAHKFVSLGMYQVQFRTSRCLHQSSRKTHSH